MKKKLTVVALVVVLVALLISGMTMAYFTDTDSATNVFTIGNIDIELDEPSWDEDAAKNALPGVTYEKDPVVKNVGDNDAYVLIEITFTGYSGSKLPTDFLLSLNTEAFEIYSNDLNKLVLKAKDKMVPGSELTIFDGVQLPSDITEDDLAGEFQIVIVANAIQADSFDTAEDAYNELIASINP